MATKRQLDQLRDARWKAEQDREFALKHGYDGSFKRKTEEIELIDWKIKKLKGLG
jgi:hypothetical protein